MQFFLIDLALAFLAVLGYSALSLAARYRAAVVSLEGRGARHRPIGSSHAELSRLAKPAQAKPAPPEAVPGKRAPRSGMCRPTLHRLINFW